MKTGTVDLPDAGGSFDLELIPYYAWANRGLANMDVWTALVRRNSDFRTK